MNTTHSLMGAWELVSGFYVGDDQVVIDYQAAAIQSLKVLSEGKYSFITTARGAFYAAGGGDYLAEDGQYVEIPGLASYTVMPGQRYIFAYRVEGDTWMNTRWQDGVQVEHEVWRRVGRAITRNEPHTDT